MERTLKIDVVNLVVILVLTASLVLHGIEAGCEKERKQDDLEIETKRRK